jgi:hypothetical protein
MKKFLLVCLALGFSSNAMAQTADQIASCNSVTGIFEIQGNAVWGYTFTMAQLVPASDTDPTLVPHIYNGFIMQVDTLAEQDMAMGEVLGICPNGTQRAGDKIYKIIVNNVKLNRGDHILHLWAWNNDENGQKRGGDIVSVPFVASDPVAVLARRPYAPINVIIYKGSGNPPPQTNFGSKTSS